MNDDLTDSALMIRSRSDISAFGVIFDRHFSAIYAYLERRLGRDGADEGAAEVFGIALQQRARFDASFESARPWLFGIANNVLLKQRRRERRRLRALSRLANTVDTTPDAYEVVRDRLTADQEYRLVMAGLARREDRDRDVITLQAGSANQTSSGRAFGSTRSTPLDTSRITTAIASALSICLPRW